MTTVLVTGGTGLLGRALIDRLTGVGADVRALSRRPRDSRDGVSWSVCDLHTGAGLADVLDGADVVVHCASEPDVPGADVETTRTLLDAAKAAGTPHLVYVSIVGIDDVPLPYYRDKRCCERMVRESGVPWSIRRITQFHQFIGTLAARMAKAPLPVVVVPRGTCQPVDVGEAAESLRDIALAAPAGRVDDLGGPEIRPIVDLARQELRRRGVRRPVVSARIPGALGAAFAAGGLTTPRHADGSVTWEQYLAAEQALRSTHAG